MSTAERRKSQDWFSDEERSTPSARQRGASGGLPSLSYFGPLSRLFSDMDRMFDTTLRNFGTPFMPLTQGLGIPGMFRPNIDIASNEEEYTITAEVPGMEEKDIRVEVTDDGLLTIRGEKRQENTRNRKDVQFTECSYGTFERSLSLPEDANPEEIDAQFRNGLLTITCPRAETGRQKIRQIQIGSGSGRRSSEERTPANQPGTGGQGSRRAA